MFAFVVFNDLKAMNLFSQLVAEPTYEEVYPGAVLMRGLALTAYDHGLLRLSMPSEGWRPGELEHLGTALRAAS